MTQLIEDYPDGMYAGYIARLWERAVLEHGGLEAVTPRRPVPIDDAWKGEEAARAGANPETNVADMTYAYRGRRPLPDVIQEFADAGLEWRLVKLERHDAFVLDEPETELVVETFTELELYDFSDPALQEVAASIDEQTILAVVLQNRVLDLVLGARASEGQRHKRTKNQHGRQIELDSIYLGDTRAGERIVAAVEAKMAADRLNRSQITSNAAWAADTYPDRVVVPVAISGTVEDGHLRVLEVLVLGYDRPARALTEDVDPYRIRFL